MEFCSAKQYRGADSRAVSHVTGYSWGAGSATQDPLEHGAWGRGREEKISEAF